MQVTITKYGIQFASQSYVSIDHLSLLGKTAILICCYNVFAI